MAGSIKNKKNQALTQFALLASILIFANILANARFGDFSLYHYLDLTEENRFTLTAATKRMLAKTDDIVYVNVLLEGSFPAGFKRLQTATRELLEDFRSETGYIEFNFEDPGLGSAEKINARREQLAKDGIIPVNLRVKSKDGTSEQLIYPYAIFHYKDRSIPVNLLENEVPGIPKEVILNSSISLLEYKFANAIQKLRNTVKPNVLFLTGHGELNELETADLEKTLRQFYEVGRIQLDSVVSIGKDAGVLVVAKPRTAFSEKDNFKIDQYVMNGGRVLWMLDPLRIDLDSLRNRKEYMPTEYPLNLDDLLFAYGARIQPNLVLDMQCTRIPLATGFVGNAPQFDYFRYPYHVVITPASVHPVVKNIGPINLFYPATIDTTVVPRIPVKRTVLLQSSPNSRYQFLPITMDFEFLRYDLDASKFDKGPQPVGLLMEGSFGSPYENRVSPEMASAMEDLGQPFRASSQPTRMMVISDGDLARNGIKIKDNTARPTPLGFNDFENYQFANKEFLSNAIEYLMDDNGIIEARGKEVKLRLLDTVKAEEEKGMWQFLNIALPLLFLGLFGWFYNWRRTKRFAKPY